MLHWCVTAVLQVTVVLHYSCSIVTAVLYVTTVCYKSDVVELQLITIMLHQITVLLRTVTKFDETKADCDYTVINVIAFFAGHIVILLFDKFTVCQGQSIAEVTTTTLPLVIRATMCNFCNTGNFWKPVNSEKF